jgi:hypothetical protein
MNDTVAETIANQSLDVLQSVASQAIAMKATLVGSLSIRKIGRSVGSGTLGIYRVTGTSQTDVGEKPWSTVVKVINTANTPSLETHLDQPERELAAYRSGVFTSTDGGMYAARYYELYEADGLQFLWQEDLGRAIQPPWLPDHFVVAARHVGRFNAYWSDSSLPDWDWLCQSGVKLKYRNAYLTSVFNGLSEIQDHPFVHLVAPMGIDRVTQLWRQGETLFNQVAKGPQGICHLDCHQKNLFLIKEADLASSLVAIDWACVGIDSLGVDVGLLLASSLKWLELLPEEAQKLVEPIFDAYLSGLRDSGWRGNEDKVKLAYLTVISMEAPRLIGLVSLAVKNPDFCKKIETLTMTPVNEVFTSWGKALAFFLDCEDEALQLSQRIY